MAKIPPRTIAVSEKERLQNLEAGLRKVIYGQDHAIAQIVNAIKIARSGLGHPRSRSARFSFRDRRASARPSWPNSSPRRSAWSSSAST